MLVSFLDRLGIRPLDSGAYAEAPQFVEGETEPKLYPNDDSNDEHTNNNSRESLGAAEEVELGDISQASSGAVSPEAGPPDLTRVETAETAGGVVVLEDDNTVTTDGGM